VQSLLLKISQFQ